MEPLISMGLLNTRTKKYRPGDWLECEYQIDAVEAGEVQAVEASVLWHTVGKGEEDLGVHYFERYTPADVTDEDLRELRRFRVQLPNSPLSYQGVIVKVHWCVRVRAFLRRGREAMDEIPFVLGNVPRGAAVERE